MRFLALIAILAVGAFCSGCGTTAIHTFHPNSNTIYGGTRYDCRTIVHKEYPSESVWPRIGSAVDLPFSFALDTVILPIDIYIWTEQPPAVFPSKEWKPIGGFDLITSSSYPTNLPFSISVAEDVQKFIQKHHFKYGPGSPWLGGYGGMEFFEDGTGRHAVKIKIPKDMGGYTVVIYFLIYDSHDVRTRVLKYKEWRSASFG